VNRLQFISLVPLVALLTLLLSMKTTRTASPAGSTTSNDKIPARGGVDYTLFGP
jgi:hypothetical protein